MTSCGLNGGPLRGTGRYEARIACNLWAKGHATGRVDGPGPRKRLAEHPYFTQSGKDREENGDQYIANLRDGACAGFKYFDFRGNRGISAEVRGKADGVLAVSLDADGREEVCTLPVHIQGEGQTVEAASRIPDGVHALYFTFRGSGALDFLRFELKA